MPVRAIFKPAIYREKRFSCACRAITISLKTPSRDRIFRRFGVFWRIRCKNRSRVAYKIAIFCSVLAKNHFYLKVAHSLLSYQATTIVSRLSKIAKKYPYSVV